MRKTQLTSSLGLKFAGGASISLLRLLSAGLFFAALFGGPPAAVAAFTPLSVNIVPPVQFPSNEFSVTGLRVSALWGSHRDLFGIDVGLIGNVTETRFVGLAVAGGFNATHGETTVLGAQLAGVANVNTNKTRVYGAQLALGFNANEAEDAVVGIQAALLANQSPFTSLYGIQLGLYNRAGDVYGVQFGLVNVATSLHGIQIGLLNFNQKGLFPVSPLLNVGF
jgi:hypothetical protein